MKVHEGRAVHAAILLIAAILLLLLIRRSYFSSENRERVSSAPVVVEISGEVPNPGIFLLRRDQATIAGALAAAGFGGHEGAGDSLEPGASLRVVKTDNGYSVSSGRMGASARLAAGLKIDINSASEEDLMLVPGMRGEIAEKIAKRRLDKPWESMADLSEIHGVGPKTAQKFEEFLEVKSYSR